jgi:hypothetical protein
VFGRFHKGCLETYDPAHHAKQGLGCTAPRCVAQAEWFIHSGPILPQSCQLGLMCPGCALCLGWGCLMDDADRKGMLHISRACICLLAGDGCCLCVLYSCD